VELQTVSDALYRFEILFQKQESFRGDLDEALAYVLSLKNDKVDKDGI